MYVMVCDRSNKRMCGASSSCVYASIRVGAARPPSYTVACTSICAVPLGDWHLVKHRKLAESQSQFYLRNLVVFPACMFSMQCANFCNHGLPAV